MKNLTTGQFFGVTNDLIQLKGLTLTDTEYTHPKVDWHYHENAYFTFILQGNVIEGNKKEVYQCAPGSLLFHNWQESHYNIKPPGFTRGFHIELEPWWFKQYEINSNVMQGSLNLTDPRVKLLMYRIFAETRLADSAHQLVVDALLTELFALTTGTISDTNEKRPAWVATIKDLLHGADNFELTLTELANILNIHPVHLSRHFGKYFNCHLGDYIRKLKVQRALALLPDTDISLTDIAFKCGFADQSHFIRTFKVVNRITPAQYRQLLKR